MAGLTQKLIKAILLIQIFGLFYLVQAIINGKPTSARNFPHQVSLRHYKTGEHFCGGAIINIRWILTAAQCTQGIKSSPNNVYAVVGATNLTNGGSEYALEKIVNHPQFNWEKRENDISMLKTIEPIAFKNMEKHVYGVFPITLANYKIDYLMEKHIGLITATVSGWGSHEMDEKHNETKLSSGLRSQEVYVLRRQLCRRRIGHVNGLLLNDQHICTNTRNEQGLCFGDIGNPLITENKELIGIASWRGGDCGVGYPDMYTRVYVHLNWIWSNIIGSNEHC